MHAFKWICLLLLCIFPLDTALQAQKTSAPSLTEIGRGAIQSAQWNPDGSYLLVTTVTGAWLYTPDLQDLAHIPDAYMAALNANGSYITGVDRTKRLRFWDAHTFLPVDPPDNTDFRNTLRYSWSPNGRYLAVVSSTNETLLTIWDTRVPWKTVLVTRNVGDQMVWSPDSSSFAQSFGYSQTVSVFSLDKKQQILEQTAPFGVPSSLIWGDSNHLFALVGGEITQGTLWDVTSGTTLFSGELCTASTITTSPDWKKFYVGCYGRLLLLDAQTGAEIGAIASGAYPSAFAFSNDGSTIASSTWNIDQNAVAQISIIDAHTGTLLQTLDGHPGSVAQLQWRPDTDQLLVVGGRGELDVFDVAQGRSIAAQTAHTISNGVVAWSSDGTRLAAADTRGNVNIWDSTTGERLNTLSGNNQPVTEIEWQPNGDWIATRGGDFWQNPDPVIRVWNTRNASSQALVQTLTFPKNNYPVGMAWSPNAQQLVNTVRGNNLYLWNVADLDHPETIPLNQANTPDGPVRWSPDGKQIAASFFSSGNGGGVYIYNVTTGELSGGASNTDTVWRWTPDNLLMWLNWGIFGDPGPQPPPFVEPIVQIVEREKYKHILVGLTQNVSGAFLSPTGRYAAATDGGGSGLIWNVLRGDPIMMLAEAAGVYWSPDESRFALQRTDAGIWIVNMDGTIGARLQIPPSLQKPNGAFYWSSDGSKLAYVHDGLIDLWAWGR